MFKLSKLSVPFTALVTLMPLIASAQTIMGAIENVIGIMNRLIVLMFMLATIVFLWGMVQYIARAGDEAARTKARGVMTWGIVGLAVMAAAWGIANVLIVSLGIGSQGPAFVPPSLP